MVVVSDTSPVSGLYRIGHLYLLELLFGIVAEPNRLTVPNNIAFRKQYRKRLLKWQTHSVAKKIGGS